MYNICKISPEGNIHAQAFDELALTIHYSILELGLSSKLQINKVDSKCINIVIGFHLLNIRNMNDLPENTILVNTEQILAEKGPWNAVILEWTKKYAVWDYSQKNIEKFNKQGVKNIKKLSFGYQSKLETINKIQKQDVDVLFYGSINERRLKILNQLRASGLKVISLFGVYGEERDILISRSKVILNLHYYETQIFEVIRVFYLLINGKAVVGEVNKDTSVEEIWLNGFCASEYENLVNTTINLVKNSNLRKELETNAQKFIKTNKQKDLILPLLA
jgi:hypothetical protein